MPQTLLTLSAATLESIDHGRLAATLETALKRATQDCIDRPSDDRVRKVVLELNLSPVCDEEDRVVYCEGVKARYQVRTKVPDWESKTLDFGVRRDGSLVFNEDAPDNHKQATIPFAEEEEI